MVNPSRGYRISDEIHSFICEVAEYYAANPGELISGIFSYAMYHTNPDSGVNIRQFLQDVRDGKFVNTESYQYKQHRSDEKAYQIFSEFMSANPDELNEDIRKFIVSEKSPDVFWGSQMPTLTKYLRVILNDYNYPMTPKEFIKYFTVWMNEQEQAGAIEAIKRDLVNDLFEKHHQLHKYIEEDA